MTGAIRDLTEFEDDGSETTLTLELAPAQSFFVVFRGKAKAGGGRNFPERKTVRELTGAWEVSFDPAWGGPGRVTFERLDDWTKRPEPGIRYYSGTAIYRTTFDGEIGSRLELGAVNHVTRVRLNDRDLGVVWCAPWSVALPRGSLRPRGNTLEIAVTNVWANRLIGDEQEPPDCQWLPGHMGGRFLKQFPDWFVHGQPRPSRGRYCFTTWNYFEKSSPLVPSGLFGPVRVMDEDWSHPGADTLARQPLSLRPRTSDASSDAFEADVAGDHRLTIAAAIEDGVSHDGGGKNADAVHNGTTRNGSGVPRPRTTARPFAVTAGAARSPFASTPRRAQQAST